MKKKKNKKTGTTGNPGKKIQPKKPSEVLASQERLSLANNSLVHVACLVFLILIIYANTLNAPFQWDESIHIVDNAIVKNLSYFAHPSEAKGLDQYDFVSRRYIAFLTFALNYRIHGLSVVGYHIVNIAIHIANAMLVYLLVLLTFKTPYLSNVNGKTGSRFTIHDSRSLIAFFSAAIFAVHPLQTEAVTYIMQRFASLMAFFYLLSLVAYIKARLTAEDKGQGGRYLHLLFYVISLVSAVLAMKTKENAFTLPFIIALYEFCFFSDSFFRRLRYLVPVLLTLCIIPLSLTGTIDIDPRAYGERILSRGDYFFTQFRVIITYLRLLFFPVNQNLDYDYPVYKSFFGPQVLLSFIFLAALLGLGVHLVKGKGQNLSSSGCSPERRVIGFGILWFFIALSVESSIIPLWMLIDEYRMYLPSIGLIISVVTGVFLLKQQLRIKHVFVLAAFVLAIAVLSVATHLRNDVWADSIRLWEDTVGKSPGKARVHCNLGIAYNSHSMREKAIEEYLIAIQLKPDYAEAHNNLGNVYYSSNMPEKAMEQYLTTIQLKPDYAQVHYNLGNVYNSRNMPEKAIEQYLSTIKLKPDYAEAHNNLGNVYNSRNMPEKAMEQYLIAIQLKPDYIEAHYNLAIAYNSRNMPEKAIEQYLSTIQLKPDFAEAHYNLGCSYYQTGQMEKARAELTAALNLKPDYQPAQRLINELSKKK